MKNIVEKQYQRLDKVYGFDNTVMDKNHENSDLVYSSFNFDKFNIAENSEKV